MAEQNTETGVATIQKADLEAAGINATLNQNDLIEVVAHDIYDKYLASINRIQDHREKLKKLFDNLLDPEIETFKLLLLNDDAIQSPTGSVDDLPGVSDDWDSLNQYQDTDYVKVEGLKTSQTDKGIIVSGRDNIDTYYVPNKQKEFLLTISFKSDFKNEVKNNKYDSQSEIIEKRVFKRKIKLTPSRFQNWKKMVHEHNEEVKEVLDFLPKNGALSVERFTREARVKMNKSMLAGQGKEFKSKMKALFNINL